MRIAALSQGRKPMYAKFLGTLTSFLITLGMFTASALAADKPNILII